MTNFSFDDRTCFVSRDDAALVANGWVFLPKMTRVAVERDRCKWWRSVMTTSHNHWYLASDLCETTWNRQRMVTVVEEDNERICHNCRML